MINKIRNDLFNSYNQSFCENTSLNNEIYCQNNSGLYCHVFPSYLYTIQHSSYEYCTNTIISELCPTSYYCKKGIKSPCPSSNFCPIGFNHPISCLFGHLSCPSSMSYKSNSVIDFILLFIIFTIFNIFYKYYSKYIIKYNNQKYIQDKHITTVQSIQELLEFQQKTVVNNKLSLNIYMKSQQFRKRFYENSLAKRLKATISSSQKYLKDIIYSGKSYEEENINSFAYQEKVNIQEIFQDNNKISEVSIDYSKKNSYSNNNYQAISLDEIQNKNHIYNTNNHIHYENQIINCIDYKDNEEDKLSDTDYDLPPPLLVSSRTNTDKNNSNITTSSGSSSSSTDSIAILNQFQFTSVIQPLTVSFRNINLELKSNNMKILNNICVYIKPFNVTAIMGPSGAGKTSLLSILHGEANRYAKITGKISVNNKDVNSLKEYKHVIGYVPQDNIVHDSLSVEENLLYASLLYNRRGYLTRSEVMSMVIEVEKLLDLIHIRTSVVGNPEKRGISGGQKKLVSIGLELMKESSLFFLDEPTSGLDSATSVRIMNVLHFLASKGVNIALTIHQPRQEIFQLMDSLILLAPGGRIAYFGIISDIQQHFSNLNYTFNPAINCNLADYILDVLCGYIARDRETMIMNVNDSINDLCNWWEEVMYPQLQANLLIDDLDDQYQKQSITLDNDMNWRFHWLIQSWKIFIACFDRQVKINYRSFNSITSTGYLLVCVGVLVSNLLGSISLTDLDVTPSIIGSQITAGSLVYSMIIQSACIKLFHHDHLLRYRELSTGIIIVPYYLGKLLGNYIEVVIYPIAFIIGYYPFLNSVTTLYNYWYVFILLYLAISGLVNFIIIFKEHGNNQTTITVGTIVILWAFGGVSPNYDDIINAMNEFGMFMNCISPFRYSYELLFINELQPYPSIFNTKDILNTLHYQTSNISSCIQALLFYWIGSNFIAYLVLQLKYISFFDLIYLYIQIRKMKEYCDQIFDNNDNNHHTMMSLDQDIYEINSFTMEKL